MGLRSRPGGRAGPTATAAAALGRIALAAGAAFVVWPDATSRAADGAALPALTADTTAHATLLRARPILPATRLTPPVATLAIGNTAVGSATIGGGAIASPPAGMPAGEGRGLPLQRAVDPAVPSARPPAGDGPLEDEGQGRRSGLPAALEVVGGALVSVLTLGGGSGGGVLLTALLAMGAFWLLRRFLLGAPMPTPSVRTEPAGWGPAPPPQADPVPPIASAAPDGGLLRLPPGFDLPAFLREARLSFVRLQSANDRADLADLREFTTPQMFAALALQIEHRQDASQKVEVMALDAQLVDLAVEHEDAVASVRFHGSARADQGAPEAFTEVWHVRKSLSDPRSAWLLDGIQQST